MICANAGSLASPAPMPCLCKPSPQETPPPRTHQFCHPLTHAHNSLRYPVCTSSPPGRGHSASSSHTRHHEFLFRLLRCIVFSCPRPCHPSRRNSSAVPPSTRPPGRRALTKTRQKPSPVDVLGIVIGHGSQTFTTPACATHVIQRYTASALDIVYLWVNPNFLLQGAGGRTRPMLLHRYTLQGTLEVISLHSHHDNKTATGGPSFDEFERLNARA